MEANGKRFDAGKPRMDLLDFEALEGLALGLTFGAEKYGPNNWRLGLSNSRIVSSLLRHLSAYQRGEDIDEESGLPHIDLIGCNWMFLSSNFKQRKYLDDRPKSINLGSNDSASSAISPATSNCYETSNCLTLEDVMNKWNTCAVK